MILKMYPKGFQFYKDGLRTFWKPLVNDDRMFICLQVSWHTDFAERFSSFFEIKRVPFNSVNTDCLECVKLIGAAIALSETLLATQFRTISRLCVTSGIGSWHNPFPLSYYPHVLKICSTSFPDYCVIMPLIYVMVQ